MKSIKDYTLEILGTYAKVIPVSLDGMDAFKKKGMTFTVKAWNIGDLRVSSIDLNAMLGLMKMESVIVTAREHDMPLFNADYVKVPKKNTLLVEMYDTCLGHDISTWKKTGNTLKSKYAGFKDYPRQSRWYDSQLLDFSLAKRDSAMDRPAIEKIVSDYLRFYESWYQDSPSCSEEDKLAKTSEYVNNLLSQGGSSTDQFKSLFGQDITEKLFMILFGVD